MHQRDSHRLTAWQVPSVTELATLEACALGGALIALSVAWMQGVPRELLCLLSGLAVLAAVELRTKAASP